MRQDFGQIFPATTPLPDLHSRLEEQGYSMVLTQYVPQRADRQPGLGLPDEEGLCEIRAYGGPGLDPVLMLAYAQGRGVPTARLFTTAAEPQGTDQPADANLCGHCGRAIPPGEEVSSCSGDSHESCRQRCESCN